MLLLESMLKKENNLYKLKEVLNYSPNTGLFTWLKTTGPRSIAGTVAGTNGRYVQIYHNGSRYQAHNIAWWYMTDKWPTKPLVIDHINKNGLDNRWSNLRLITYRQNSLNRNIQSNNKTGYRGITLDKDKYIATIGVNNVKYFIGIFNTAKEAAIAYDTFIIDNLYEDIEYYNLNFNEEIMATESSWTDELKQEVVDAYLERNPTPENTSDIVKELADEYGKTVNGIRIILQKAEVYVKKEQAKPEGKEKTKTGGTRVSKEESIGALKELITAAGGDVDDSIVDKLTGKAAVYFTGLIKQLAKA